MYHKGGPSVTTH